VLAKQYCGVGPATGGDFGQDGMRAERRKITVEVPAELFSRAQTSSGAGITQTVPAGLEQIVAAGACDRRLEWQRKVQFSRSPQELKEDQ
jgi:hypothetical protein